LKPFLIDFKDFYHEGHEEHEVLSWFFFVNFVSSW